MSDTKSQRKETRGIPPLSLNGSLHADPKEKVEILSYHFSSVFSDKKSTPCTYP